MVLQWWKQGLGFILSLVATPNNINIIESHDISHKTCKGDALGGHSFVVKRGRELCRATKAQLKVRSSQPKDFPMSPRPSKGSTTITTTYLKDSQRQAPRDSQSSIHTQKEEITHENILLIHVQ